MKTLKIERRFLRYWLVFFGLHLVFLLFAVLNVYAMRRYNSILGLYVLNDLIFNLCFLVGLFLFGASLFFRKTFKGFFCALSFCLLSSFTGLLVLFGLSSFYFLLWFMIGFLGMAIHLYRNFNLEET